MPGSPVGVIFQGANSSPPICSVNKWMVSSSQRGYRLIRSVLMEPPIENDRFILWMSHAKNTVIRRASNDTSNAKTFIMFVER